MQGQVTKLHNTLARIKNKIMEKQVPNLFFLM